MSLTRVQYPAGGVFSLPRAGTAAQMSDETPQPEPENPPKDEPPPRPPHPDADPATTPDVHGDPETPV
jgi:hypothetical protein